MMNLLLVIATSVAVSLAAFVGLVFLFQRGMITFESDRRLHQDIHEDYVRLSNLLDDTKAERNQLLEELAQANREISSLRRELTELRIELTKFKKASKKEQISVLAIWPQAGIALNQDGDRDALYNAGIDYVALRGDQATRANVLREFRQSNYTILEIGAHGSVDGIALFDSVVGAGWWQRVISNRSINVAVLLTCYSDTSLTDALKRAGVKHIIAVMAEIEDKAAVAFAQAFYANYADGMEIEKAVSEAKLVLDLNQAEKIVLR